MKCNIFLTSLGLVKHQVKLWYEYSARFYAYIFYSTHFDNLTGESCKWRVFKLVSIVYLHLL